MTSKLWQGAAGLLLLFSLGCTGAEKESTPGPHGSHGGHTFRMPDGSELALELTIDDANRRIVVYAEAVGSNQPFAVDATQLKAKFESDDLDFSTTLSSDPRKSDPKGESSRFAISLDELPQQLFTADEFRMTVWYPDADETHSVSMLHRNDHAHSYRHD
ncbi:MAG TPA: hypothetical protein DDW52_16820 [Planctomycetaceae bacterium]|nr:hypothetical protein [Planctomycetaceae bacterium]